MEQGDFLDWIPELGEYVMRTNYEEIVCKFCGSAEIVKNGTRGSTQYWLISGVETRNPIDTPILPKWSL